MAVQSQLTPVYSNLRSVSPTFDVSSSKEDGCCCNISTNFKISINSNTLTALGCSSYCNSEELGFHIDVKFNGVIEHGMPVGIGTIDFIDSNHSVVSLPLKSYVGQFNKGKLFDGKGRLEYLDGSVFEGTFSDGALVNGKMIYSNGDIYEGNFQNGLPDGNGTLTKSVNTVNGKLTTIFKGNFERNCLINGTKDLFLETFWGVQKLRSYDGEFKVDGAGSYKPFGRGTYTDTTYSGYKTTLDIHIIDELKALLLKEDQYVLSQINGQFDADVLNGKAVVISANKQWFYVGEFVNNKLVGDITLFELKKELNTYKCVKKVYNNLSSDTQNTVSYLSELHSDNSKNKNHLTDNVIKDKFYQNIYVENKNSDYLGAVLIDQELSGNLIVRYHGNGVLHNKLTNTKKMGQFLYGQLIEGNVIFGNNVSLSISRSRSDRIFTIEYKGLKKEFVLPYQNFSKLPIIICELEKLETDICDFSTTVENLFKTI